MPGVLSEREPPAATLGKSSIDDGLDDDFEECMQRLEVDRFKEIHGRELISLTQSISKFLGYPLMQGYFNNLFNIALDIVTRKGISTDQDLMHRLAYNDGTVSFYLDYQQGEYYGKSDEDKLIIDLLLPMMPNPFVGKIILKRKLENGRILVPEDGMNYSDPGGGGINLHELLVYYYGKPSRMVPLSAKIKERGSAPEIVEYNVIR